MEKREGQRQCFLKLKSVGLFSQFKDYEAFERNEERKRKKREEKTAPIKGSENRFCFK